MTAQPLGTNRTVNVPSAPARRSVTRRLSTETKASWKTTEFWIYIAVVIGILIASQTVGSDSNATAGNSGDYFRADKAWLFIVIATVGYLLSRGLAKAGSRDYYNEDNSERDDD